ncbi:MAG: hydantoinase/oxoprolinase family protein [Thermodesulfobacteriota bacterium]|nr:hydantoinase/oxoprolinase family protein [Thermodesulfobacteriota bacterium]
MMKSSIDVDIGGTFTDCFVNWEGKPYYAKTPTTGYNLSVGFMKALREVSNRVNVPFGDLLQETGIIRYSTTVAMNTLIQRTGPKLALLTTEGIEDTIFVGRGAQWADGLSIRQTRNLARQKKPEPLIPREMTVGIRERIDSFGNIIRPLDEEDVRDKIKLLVDKGVRGFVICLLWSFLRSDHEKRIAEIIREEYPESYLGSMPVILSSEVLPKRLEYQRMMVTILNAYLHGSMAGELRDMGDELRSSGYNKSMMMVHNTGGMAEVFRTIAVQTFNGGPVAGLIGCAYLGEMEGYDNVVMSDMGGTSFDIGLVSGGSARFYAFQPVIDRWQVNITMLETKSIGAGGGSIAWVNRMLGNKIEVGPQSAGSMPGPACYDQGGTEPTVTDADVVLGYINPDYYAGGKIQLDRLKAELSIKEHIARPLQIEVVEAALLIKKIVDGNMGNAIFTETVLRGLDPSKFILFAFGGAGPTHCCGYGFKAGISKIMTFPFAPVFCAFGSANMDIMHIYEYSKRIPLLAPMTREAFSDYVQFNDVVNHLQKQAIEELAGQGFSENTIVFSLELDMKYGGVLNVLRVNSPRMFIGNESDIQAIYDVFENDYSEVYSPLATNIEGGVDIENLALRATVPQSKMQLPVYELKGEKPASASMKGKRPVFWEGYGDFRETNIYNGDLLECGNILDGPAVVEFENTTLIIPPETRLTINKYLNGEITKI